MKAITNQSGLYRTENSYYFRKSIPAYAQLILGMTEVKKSFKKDMYRIAKVKTAYMNDYLERLFIKMKDIQPTSDEVNNLIRNHFEKLLLDAEGDIYLDNEVWQEEYPIDAKESHDGASPMERIEQLEEELKLYKEGLINQQAKPFCSNIAETLLEWKGYEYFEMSPVAHQLCKGIMEARIEALRMEVAQRCGEISDTDIRHPLFKDVRNFLANPDIDIQIANEGLPYYKTISNAPSLSELIEKYLENKKQSVAESTINDIRNLLDISQSFLGVDTPINDITTEQCRNLRDIIKKMPKNYHQKYARTGKTIGDVIANEKYEVLAAKTISKYWAWIKAFFEWCYIEDYANANVAQKLTVENAKSSINDRMPFNKEQLETFFNSPQYVGHGKHRTQEGDEVIKDTMYWMPLVALYTGARLGELVTLQCKDIIKQDRFYYISINTNSDLKNLKTKQSERVIPIHPDLLEIGFIKYVEEQNNKHGENSRLFHHIPIPKNAGASHTATKRFKTYINGIGLGNSGVVFHSFRHNFADSMRRAEIDAERMDALTGHKQMSGKNARAIYGSKFRPQDLYPSICKMRFEVDLSHLK